MKRISAFFLTLLIITLTGCMFGNKNSSSGSSTSSSEEIISIDNVPDFSGSPYCIINGNVPYFTEDEITDSSYEYYGELDELGRCTLTMACVGQDLMPTEERGAIGMIRPTGWQLDKYDFVEGKYLYNRCHLIGYQLTAENANERNLVTGTRYLNVQGMLPYENIAASYVRRTGNHLMYRVTPIFKGSELVCRGVLMEAYSVEDSGEGVKFCIYCYNAQPGVEIDYMTGKSEISDDNAEAITEEETTVQALSVPDDVKYVLNTRSKKVHRPDCQSVQDMSPKNREYYYGALEELLEEGYSLCGACKPE